MTADADPRTRLSGRLSVAVAALAAVALGVDIAGPEAAAGVAGALAFALGVDALEAESYRRQAGGSIALVVGGLAMLGSILTVGWFVPGLTMAVALVAVAVLGIAASGGIPAERFGPASASLVTSLIALALALGLAFVFAGVDHFLGRGPLALLVGTWVLFGRLVGFVSALPVLSLAAVQVGALALLPLLDAARSIVDRWFRGDVPVASWDLLEATVRSSERLPFAYRASLPFQAILGLLPWPNAALEWVLSSLWLFGTALELLLTSGALLWGLALVALVPLAVLVAEAGRRVVDFALRPVPARKAALGAGGASVAVLGSAGTTVAFAMGRSPWPVENSASATVLALVGPVVGVGVLYALVVTIVVLGDLVVRRPSGVVVGAGLLLLATFGGAAAGAPPAVVFAGVAAALAAWDLGSTAADLGGHLGPDAETRRAEVVHATGTVGVGLAGIALATAAIYLLGPLAVASERAGAALVLVLVGLLALAARHAIQAAYS